MTRWILDSVFVLCICVIYYTRAAVPDLEVENENSLETKAFPGRKVVCYFGSWAVYRPEKGKFDVESIDPFSCTHLIYGFAGLRNGEISVLDPYNEVCEDWGQGALKRFTNLKRQNPNLITMAAIGGWNEGSERYSDMAKTPESRKKFIISVVNFLERFDFDGFDLDWEYPANRGGVPEDKANFASLLKEMRSEFDKHAYLLSAAVSAGEATIRTAYDVPALANYLDFINVMAYDFHGAWDMKTGHHSPMYKSPLDPPQFDTFNVNHSIHFWISEGAPREKLILGIGSYGRGVLLDNESQHGLYAPGSQPLPQGPFTREVGYWGYNEICEFLKEDGWSTVVHTPYVAPYSYKGRLWVGYDDLESVKYKSDYIVSMGLGGGMFWSLETDDFQGSCHGERFPLIKTTYRTIIGKYPPYKWEPKPPRSSSKEVCRPDVTTIATETAAYPAGGSGTENVEVETPTPTVSPPSPGICTEQGLIGDPTDCTKFINCVKNDTGFTAYSFQCGAGTAFLESAKMCTHAADVPGCNAKSVSFHRQGSL